MSLTRDAVLDANDVKIQEVPVPEWGGTIHVKTLSGTARDVSNQLLAGGKDEGYHAKAARFIAACACDAEGTLLFAEADVEKLAAKASHVLGRVFKAALAVNGIGQDALETAAKN